jgi:hypothetical protein
MGRPFITLTEGADRLWHSLQQAYLNRGRRSRWIVRIASLAVAVLAVTQLIPTLAEESTPPPNESVAAAEVNQGDSVVVLSASDDLASNGDNSAVSSGQDTQVTYSTLETETALQAPPIVLSSNQSISSRIPAVIKVDPRSVTALLPSIAVAGEETLLLCIRGEGLRFDGSSKGFVDDVVEEDFIADGDLTGSLRISGGYDRVVAYLNSEGGLRIWSNNGVVAGKALSISAVALTGVSVEPDFCGQGRSQYVEVRAIGLGMNTKKGGVRLN